MTDRQRQAAARVLQALAHPLRLGIIEALADGEKPLRELHGRCACSQPMFSQQVRLLEQQGLIRTRKEGTAKYCALRNPDFLKLFICLDRHLREVLNIKEKE